MMKQHPTAEQLIDYLHRELQPSEDATMLAHLEECGQCRSLYESEARLSEVLRSHAHATERELPQGVVNSIWAAIEAQDVAPSFWERLARALRPIIAIPVAAVAVAAAFVGFIVFHPNASATTIEAAYYLNDHAALTRSVPFSEGIVVPTSLENDETGADQHWVAVDETMTTADAR